MQRRSESLSSVSATAAAAAVSLASDVLSPSPICASLQLGGATVEGVLVSQERTADGVLSVLTFRADANVMVDGLHSAPAQSEVAAATEIYHEHRRDARAVSKLSARRSLMRALS